MSLHKYVGIVTPAKWSAYGDPVSFSLYTDDGEDVLLDCSRSLSKIKKLVGKRVKVKGVKHSRDCLNKIIIPQSIKKVRKNLNGKIIKIKEELPDYTLILPNQGVFQSLVDSFEKAS